MCQSIVLNINNDQVIENMIPIINKSINDPVPNVKLFITKLYKELVAKNDNIALRNLVK